ncbi:MAG: beta-ketoacyl synthase N-terminal-like domain-containing protein [Streptosporangiaceae bacterium]
MTQDEAAPRPPGPARAAIAVVGLACRFPDADDPAALLDVVVHGRRAFRRIPQERVDLADYYDGDREAADATYSTRAALIEGWRFDRIAFGVSKPDFASTDPAHWLALETTARALAAAGFPGGAGLPGDRAGVFFGSAPALDASPAAALRLRWPYARRVLAAALADCQVPVGVADRVLAAAGPRYLAPLAEVTAQTLAGSTAGTLVATICRHLGLRGGGYAVDAAGASSLAATVSACVALAAGEVDVAVAGGVDLGIGPLELVGLAKAGLLATGEVRVYDQSPTGLLPGEGCGVVLLMRASDARAADLPVFAEITGWGTASAGQAIRPEPDGAAHLLAMRRAHEMSGVDPADIQLVEGAGTGDQAGDQAELAAFAALRAGARHVAALGTISANIGHAGAAAGSAGLIKAVLAIANGVLPPSTGVRTPHPVLRDGRPALRLPAAAEAWPAGLRQAAVSAAGPDGLAVHLLLRGEPGEPVSAGKAAQARSRALPRAVQARPPAQARSLRQGKLRKAALPPENLTEPGRRLPATRPAGRHPGTGHQFAYVLQAPDQRTMIAVLSRIGDLGPWLSDAELQDLAVLLARTHGAPAIPPAGRPPAGRPADAPPAPGPPGLRIALIAASQDELAARATQAMALLPELTSPGLRTRPGIFAAGPGTVAAGRVALVISGQPDDLADLPQRQLSRILAVLRWLEDAGVETAAAVGHGIGEIAGLVWAGCTTPGDARTLTALRSSALGAAADAAPGQLGSTIGKYGTIAFQPGQRRLISGATGREIGDPGGIAEVLCAELFETRLAADAAAATLSPDVAAGPPAAGPTAAGPIAASTAVRPLAAAIAAVAQDAALVVRTGRDERLSNAIALLGEAVADIGQPVQARRPGAAGRSDLGGEPAGQARPGPAGRQGPIPMVGIDGDPSDDGVVAQAAAALFVAGALTRPASLYAERPSRAFDLWRDPVFLADPCQAPLAPPSPASAQAEPAAAPAEPEPATTPAEPEPEPAPASPQAAATGRASSTAAWPTVPAPRARRPARQDGAGSRPWFRCYAEHTQRPSFPVPVGDERPWRLHTGGCEEFEPEAGELFRPDPAARRTLAVLGPLDRAGSRSALLRAATDAIGTGSLVVISPGPGPAGLLATLHAENPALGITALRAPLTPAGLLAAKRFAATAPGHYRELVIGQDGTPAEPVLSPLTGPGGGDFPLGSGDVMLISRASGAGGLALAQVLACSGAAIAIVGRDRPGPDDQVIAGLEELRNAGARVGYELVSLSDHAALAAAIRRIEARFGRVTAIAHAVGALSRGELEKLSQAQAERQVLATVSSLDQIAAAVRAVARSGTSPAPLRLVVTSGSIAGRYGMAAEGTTALASAALADYGDRVAAASPGCRALHLDWPGWDGDGLGERAGFGALLAGAGISAIPVAEGSRQLLKALGRDGRPGRLAVHGRAGVPAPRPIAVAGARRTRENTAPAGRFAERVPVHYPGVEVVTESTLAVLTDPYLADYRIDGLAVLPPTLALEAMAQAAALLAPGEVHTADDVLLDAPVVLPPGTPAVIRISAVRDGDAISVRLRCDDSGFAVDHCRATFRAGRAEPATAEPDGTGERQPEASGTEAATLPAGQIYGPVCFQAGRFRVLTQARPGPAGSATAAAAVASDEPWFGAVPPPRSPAGPGLVLGSPALADAALQLAQVCVPGRRLLFAGCDQAWFSGRAAGGLVTVQVTPAGQPGQPGQPDPAERVPRPRHASGQPRAEQPLLAWDATVTDAGGQLLVAWRGLRMRDAGPLPGYAATAPSDDLAAEDRTARKRPAKARLAGS